MREKLSAIGEAFRLKGTLEKYEVIRSGNINATYKVTYRIPREGRTPEVGAMSDLTPMSGVAPGSIACSMSGAVSEPGGAPTPGSASTSASAPTPGVGSLSGAVSELGSASTSGAAAASSGQLKSYIFQKINTYVFRDPEGIMENIDLVTEHIRRRFPEETTLHFHHTGEGRNFLYDPDGGFWRVMNYVDSISYDTCDDPAVIQATGEAFGHFQNQLADLDGSRLHETIPDFHNTRKRLDTLFAHVAANAQARNTADAQARNMENVQARDMADAQARDTENAQAHNMADLQARNQKAAEEIAYLASVREEAAQLSELYNRGEFPVRVTHNDTKSNNVLFDRVTKRPLLVIDLDTVMPGMSVYDFGDAVRFICSTAAEDEPDLARVSFDTEKFRAFCRGYLGAVKDSLLPIERENLAAGAFAITVELASRFLDDYLTGDPYFKIDYPEHNLVRARCQLALAKDMQRKRAEMERIIAECL